MSGRGGASGARGDPGLAHLLACVVARELRDGDIVAFGLHAELMLAAALVAQRLHAPNLIIRHGLRAGRGAEIGPAAWSDDPRSRSHETIEYLESHDAILDVAAAPSPLRFCDVFFASGMQIDREGNVNLIGIKGKDGGMATRGPGSIGTSSIGTLSRRLILFSADHTSRRFVEQVDYVSVPGWRRRAAAGLSGGPDLCVTPLAVLDFGPSGGGRAPEERTMRLRSVHRHSTVEEVRRRTGFPLEPAGDAPVTLPPTRAERTALEAIDPRVRLAALPLRAGER